MQDRIAYKAIYWQLRNMHSAGMSETKMPDPGPIMQAMTAYWVSGAVKGAIELDLFTHISQGKATIDELAEAAHATPRGIRAIANAMVSLGFLQVEKGRYANTSVAETFMCSDKPSYFAGFSNFLQAEPFVDAFSKVAEAARTGKSVFDKNAESPDNPLWVTFAESSLVMAIGGTMPLVDMIEARRPGLRILDVAAGSGGYGITLAQASEGSSLTVLDWPNVAAVARRHADAMGVGDRTKVINGSAFDVDWGGPYDVVVMGNFFHHFDRASCVKIARKAKASLAEGGVFATAEFVADEERQQPGVALLFAVAMLVWSDEGNAYTFSELKGMLEEADFGTVTHQTMGDNPSSWVIGR